MAAILAEVLRRTRRVADQVSKLEPEEPPIPSPSVVAKTFAELGTRLMADPAKFVQQQLELCQQYATLWESAQRRLAGEAVEALVAPARDDRRFKDPAWSEEPVFDILKQAYLLTAKWVDGTIRGVDGLDPAMRRKALFYSRQMIDAMAPTNFAMTNPEVLRATFASQGENLVRGLGNYLDDLERGKGHLDIRTTDDKPFVLGETIVTTPGKVVHQSELMQLIQYDPQTPQVHRTPLVIVPPWINKYYILDLRPKNSLIRWLVQQGFTVFVVSWANPGAALAHKDFGDYMEEGPLAALAAAKAATGAERVHMTGYCIGGTLQGCALATLARNRPSDRSVASATFFTAMLDFSDPGDLAVFIDEDQLAELDQNMAAKGYLDGRAMSKVFSMLRDNDLIWSFVVNNYLLGKDPLPFDLLYWNADSTRMPAMMHSFYLRSMYLENKLRVPDAVTLKGTPI
ncbi:MAG: class I poly(R)-hydroxyalkanoic acid synthase, partial [Alphaproteobacteria bacterium]|nr:class I poly(R)-hydroxyalkanoic acid synthase [Alphaproteobacteria bacterium]